MKRSYKVTTVALILAMLAVMSSACSGNDTTTPETDDNSDFQAEYGEMETVSGEGNEETGETDKNGEFSGTTDSTSATELPAGTHSVAGEGSDATAADTSATTAADTSATTAPKPGKVKVSDAYKKTFKTEFLGKVTSRYPKVVIEGVDTSAFNKAIAKKYKKEAKTSEVDYWYYIGKETVTVFISVDADADYYDHSNDVYNISRYTGKQMTRKQMLKVCGLSSSKFNSRVKKAIKKQWKEPLKYNDPFVKTQFKKATSKKSLNRAMPYYNKKGKLCFLIKNMDTLGGSGYEDACGTC